MDRYINADAFIKNMSEIKESVLQNHSLKRGNEPIDGYDADFLRAIGFAKQLLDEFPTAYFRENIKGKWIERRNGQYECSVCGETFCIPYIDNKNFCMSCGADMRGEE